MRRSASAGCLPRSRQVALPAAARRHPMFWVASLGVHALAILGLIKGYTGFRAMQAERRAAAVVAIAIAPPPAAAEDAPPPPRSRALVAPVAPSNVVSVPSTTAEPFIPGGDTAGVAGGRPGGRGLAGLARAGDPRLYAAPRYIPPPGEGRPIDMDSAMRRTLLTMADQLDSLNLIDSMGYRRPPYATPSWVIERNGKKYGIDQNAIHLGSFSIPTALLALLPMPQGNIDQARANARIMDMRSEILRAAARSEAEEDFRRAVAQIRERRQRERDEERRRRQQESGGERPIN